MLFSYIFYILAGGIRAVAFLIVTTASTFAAGILLEKKPKNRGIVAVTAVINIGILVVLKYGNFIWEQIGALLAVFGIGNAASGTLNVGLLLPLGLSFYTFQAMGYVIDVYRGKVKADRNIFQYALFLSYFPQITQGPIGRYNKLAFQLYDGHPFDYNRMCFGLQRAVWGYFKKMVIADRLAVLVNEVFNNYSGNGYVGFEVFMGVFLYGIQIYADFSGGVDVCLGISEVLGIKMSENFRQPFFARNITEFWQRWHITLGSWMKDYVFYPIALSKGFTRMGKKTRKIFGSDIGKLIPTCLASFIVFLLVGIWHGASWKYVGYGLYQAFFVSTDTLFEPLYAKMRSLFRINTGCVSWKLFQILRTNFIVVIGRYMSRANSMSEAIGMYKATLAQFNPWILFDDTLYGMGISEENFRILIWAVLVMLAVDILHELKFNIRELIAGQDIVFRWVIFGAAVFSIVLFGAYGPLYDAGAFIYQGF